MGTLGVSTGGGCFNLQVVPLTMKWGPAILFVMEIRGQEVLSPLLSVVPVNFSFQNHSVPFWRLCVA